MTGFADRTVGEVRRFGRYEVTREEVLAFARAYDPQPFHLSDEGAAGTHFGRLAASGWHSCAITMAMLVADLSDRGEASLGSPGVDELRWLKPVHPGDVLRCESELLDKRLSQSRPDLGILRSRTTVFNQDDASVLRFVSTVFVAVGPDDAG